MKPEYCLKSCIVVLVVSAVIFSRPFPARAYDYRVTVQIDDEEDIYELVSSGDISTTEEEQLLALFHEPIDINSASRNELYNLPGVTYGIADRIIARRQDEPFEDLEDLEEIKGVTDSILDQLENLARVIPPLKPKKPKKKLKLRGRIKVQAVDRIKDEKLRGGDPEATPWSQADDDYPEGYTLVETKVPEIGFSAGAVVLTQNTVGKPRYVNVNDADTELDKYEKYKSDRRTKAPKDVEGPVIWSSGTRYLPTWPLVYAAFDKSNWKLIVGSYNVGFGQRAVFDTTGTSTPHGFRPNLYASVGEKSISFSPSRTMFGIAGTYITPSFGPFSVDLTAFASWWRHDLYFQHAAHINENNKKESYTVLTNPPNESFGSYYKSLFYQYPTLPRAYDEIIEGGNATLNIGPRAHLGLTGYARQINFNLDDPKTAFVDYVSQPDRNNLYVFGADFQYGLDRLGPIETTTFFGEGAYMDNGGYAVILRAISELGRTLVVEPSYRYYSDRYDNPHSRMPSQDEFFDGNRDRAEHGGRLSVRFRPFDWLRVRFDQDVWKVVVREWIPEKDENTSLIEDPGPGLNPIRLDSYLALDLQPVERLSFKVYANYVDKDIAVSGRDESYSNYGGTSDDEVSSPEGYPVSGTGKKITGRGEKWKFGGYASTKFIPQTSLKIQYNQSLSDVQKNQKRFGREHYGVFEFRFLPLGFWGSKYERLLSIKGRAKYFEGQMVGEDLREKDERFWTAYVQLGTTIKRRYSLLLKGAMIDFLTVKNDDGEAKDPSPTEYFWKATLQVKF